jgi:hypothetical protein
MIVGPDDNGARRHDSWNCSRDGAIVFVPRLDDGTRDVVTRRNRARRFPARNGGDALFPTCGVR